MKVYLRCLNVDSVKAECNSAFFSVEFIIFFVGKDTLNSELHSLFVFSLQFLDLFITHNEFRNSKGDTFNEVKVGITGELSEDPEEGLFVLIVRLSRDVVVLERSLSVESDLSSLDLSVLRVDLITNQNDGNVFADSGQILVPLRNIFIGDSGGDVEHHDSGISTNVVTFTETTELFLTSSIPNVESDGTLSGV